MLLKDRTAIVYGGSGAVGGAVAKAFAREGARVFIAARRVELLEAVARDIRDAGGQVEVAPVDAADKDAVAAHLAAIVEKSGPVKVMFNAVEWGDTQGTPVIDMDLERFIRPVRNGLTTWFHTGTAVARHMGENGGGAIVGITANAGRQALPSTGGFGVACAAVEHSCAYWRSRTGRKACGSIGCVRRARPMLRASAKPGNCAPMSGE